MNYNTRDNYGFHTPSRFIAWLITLAQNCPHNPLGRLIALILRKLVLLLSRPPVDTAVGDIKLRCYLNDNVSERKFVFLPWLYDRAERDLIADLLPADGVFVDIGANVGIYSLWACQYLSRQGTVLAIEPNPLVYERLLFNLEINQAQRTNWPRVLTAALAVSDREGLFDLNLDSTNLGGSSLVSHSDSADKIHVQSQPLLTILTEFGIDRINILKIDIEGAEDIALSPFLKTTDDHLLPQFIIIENSERLWRSDLAAKIKNRSYEVEFRTRMNTVYRLAAA